MGENKQPHREKSGYIAVLSHRQFRSLWFGQICSQLASNMMLFVLALRVYQLTNSNTAVSGLFLTFGIPAVLFGMLAGTIVDKLDNRWTLMVCDGLRAIVSIGLLFFSQSIIFIYIFAFINAVITQFYVPSEAPMIPRLVPQNLLISANSLFSFTYYSSLGAGSIIAGPMLKLLGSQSVFTFISLLFIIALFFVSYLPRKKEVRKNLATFILQLSLKNIVFRISYSLKDGLYYVKKSPVLTDAILLLTGTQVIMAMLGTLAPGFTDRILQIDIHDASLIIIGPMVFGIITGAIWIGSRGYKYKPTDLIKRGITGAGIMLIAVSIVVRLIRVPAFTWFYDNSLYLLPFVLFLFFLLGVFNSLLDVPANSIIQHESSADIRGRVYGILTAAVGGIGILPIVFSGILADTIGVGKVIFLLGVAIVAYGMYRIKYNKSVKRD